MNLDILESLRQRAIDELEQHGIRGPNVYLIDIIPLIEMIWADGRVQEGELEILRTFCTRTSVALTAWPATRF
jgi:hypothetical protein